MPGPESHTGLTKLIVAFDIGTTHSRVSYCILKQGQVPEVPSVMRFPVQARLDPEIPSLLYYDKSGTVRAAGAEVLTENIIKNASTEGWTKAEWWKLHLRPKHYLRLDDDLPTLPPGKSAVDVLSDFIGYLFHCAKTYIQEYHPDLTWSTLVQPVEYIFTYPSGLGVKQDLYLRAIERAGIVPSTLEGRSRVHMLTEGEASLHFCAANLLGTETTNQTIPQGIVVIDAGGGIITLSMFSTTFNPTCWEEIAPAECQLQGSVFVTRRAGVLLQRKLKGWKNPGAEDIAQYISEFDQTTKLVIESDQEPIYVGVGRLRMNSPDHGISFGELRLSGEEAAGLFKESIDAIISAFEQQQNAASMQITTIFLVGGLSINGWLWSQVQSYFKARNINICRPDNHIETVASGAVLSRVCFHSRLLSSNATHAEKTHRIATVSQEYEKDFYQRAEPQMRCNTRSLIPGIGAFQRWVSEGTFDADKAVLDGDSSLSSGNIHNVLARNALLGIRSKNWSHAYEDAEKSIEARPSAIGYIAKALILANKGEPERAMQVFDLVFGDCDPNEGSLLLLIKAIMVYVTGKRDDATSRIRDLITLLRDEETIYCCIQVLGSMYLMQSDYGRALESLKRGQNLASSCTSRHLDAVSTIFGWTFDGLEVTAQLHHCEAVLTAGRTEDAAEALLKIFNTFGQEMREGTTKWAIDLKKKCVEKLQRLGDAAFRSGKLEEAIARYSVALSLSPANSSNILVERSRARASKGLWQEALADADEAIKLDPSLHLGYERKCAAFNGAENYVEATAVLRHMLSVIERSPDEEIRRLRDNYINPDDVTKSIEAAIHEIFHLCPLVLIDLRTGELCDADERIRLFKSETPFEKLVLEGAITKLDYPRIRQVVAKYFQWAMFSHTWEGREPTFQDVNVVDSVWSLGKSPLNEKLCQFCATSRADGHRWAWSDTCCIDKSTSAILSQSLTSMYTWYEEAAETLVYLADVLSSAKLGDLTKSRWMSRAWTLQELLASKVIRFYNREWKPYLNDMHRNHKESLLIRQELAEAMGVAPETISGFRPEDLGVREKLRLASKRHARRQEDIAYSLIGIFSSNIRPQYGLGKTALGELLENIVDRTGDVTVIAWTGKSLPYNSALPDSLAVYSQTPYTLPLMEADELDGCVERLRTGSVTRENVLRFYNQVIRLHRATFSNRRLRLPCICFYVTKIGVQELGGSRGNLYRTMAPPLGKVEFRTTDAMPLQTPRKLIFVHPWLRDLHDAFDAFVSDDEEERETNDGLDDEAESNAGFGDSNDSGDSDVSLPADPLLAEPSVQVDPYIQALRLIVRLGRPFNALLLEWQNNGQYKRVATEHEIIVSGVPHEANLGSIRARVLEIV